jgi:hypothetical protein
MERRCWYCNGPILPGEDIEEGTYGVEISPPPGVAGEIEVKEGTATWHTACVERSIDEPDRPPRPYGFDNGV